MKRFCDGDTRLFRISTAFMLMQLSLVVCFPKKKKKSFLKMKVVEMLRLDHVTGGNKRLSGSTGFTGG